MSEGPLNTAILLDYFDKHEPGSASIYAVAFRSTGKADGIPGWNYQTFPASDSGRRDAEALAATTLNGQMFVREHGHWRRIDEEATR